LRPSFHSVFRDSFRNGNEISGLAAAGVCAINPNSEVGNEIEKTRRAPSMVGRVTPCAPRLQPEWTSYFSHRISNSLPVKVCFKFPRSNSGFRD
jgi:hypothetical protein